jgi:hypothetical protein
MPTDNPAKQPKPPVDDCHKCSELPVTTPPTVPEPEKCPDPPPECKCPPPATNTANCLEKAIEKQAKRLAQAEKAKTFKADLEARLQKATTAAQQHNTGRIRKLPVALAGRGSRHRRVDSCKITCAVPCWRCLIECYVCPILNALHDNEQRLWGNGTLPATASNRYDLQYC